MQFYSFLKLVESEKYSWNICVVCHFQLKEFCIFKKNVTLLQKGLLSYVPEAASIKLEADDMNDSTNVMVKTEKELENCCKSDEFEDDSTEFLDFSGDLQFGKNKTDLHSRTIQYTIINLDFFSRWWSHLRKWGKQLFKRFLPGVSEDIFTYMCDWLCCSKANLKFLLENIIVHNFFQCLRTIAN